MTFLDILQARFPFDYHIRLEKIEHRREISWHSNPMLSKYIVNMALIDTMTKNDRKR